MDAAQILVIILAIFLAIFLLLAIILVVLLIKVTRQIKTVTESAARTATMFEHVIGGVHKVISPAVLAKTFFDQMKKAKKYAEKKGRHFDES